MTYGVMVALQILVLSVKVRILMGQHKPPGLGRVVFLFSVDSMPAVRWRTHWVNKSHPGLIGVAFLFSVDSMPAVRWRTHWLNISHSGLIGVAFLFSVDSMPAGRCRTYWVNKIAKSPA